MLLYWLGNEDVYTSDYVRGWLQRTSPEEAATDLARIAQYAQPEPHSIWYSLYRGSMMVLATSESISVRGPAGRKAGTRAALLLAKMGDARCIAPLVRVLETHWLWKGKYQDAVEEGLLRFLSGARDRLDLSEDADALRILANKIWHAAGGRTDLSPRLRDLLVVTLESLKGTDGQQYSDLLRKIAGARAATANKRRVREAAITLLDEVTKA